MGKSVAVTDIFRSLKMILDILETLYVAHDSWVDDLLIYHLFLKIQYLIVTLFYGY